MHKILIAFTAVALVACSDSGVASNTQISPSNSSTENGTSSNSNGSSSNSATGNMIQGKWLKSPRTTDEYESEVEYYCFAGDGVAYYLNDYADLEAKNWLISLYTGTYTATANSWSMTFANRAAFTGNLTDTPTNSSAWNSESLGSDQINAQGSYSVSGNTMTLSSISAEDNKEVSVVLTESSAPDYVSNVPCR